MFTAIISTIIQNFSDIFWKKSLNYWVWWKAHDLLSYPTAWVIIFYFLAQGSSELKNIDFFIFAIVFAILFIAVLRTSVIQKIYREEKISVIMPFTNVNKILAIIFSFFIFSDVSITSLLITLVAVIIIIVSSIDFKTLKFPRNISMLLISEIVAAIVTISWWWIINKYSEIIYFVLAAITWWIILIVFSFIKWEFKDLKWLPKSFWYSRLTGSLWRLSWYLSLVVIKNLGLSMSILLSFLWIWVTLALSYFILKDKPTKKDLILTIIVTTLVWLWFLYK